MPCWCGAPGTRLRPAEWTRDLGARKLAGMPNVVLFQFPPMPGLPSISPFCTKVHFALRLKGVAYETRSTLFPKKLVWNGQLPYVTWDGQGLTDSSAILHFLDEKVPSPRLYPTDAQLAAEVHVLEDWSDESLYWFACYSKFVDPQGWAEFRPKFAAAVPAHMRPLAPIIARRRMIGLLRAQGVMRRTPEMILAHFSDHLDALETKVTNGYLVGDSPTAADLSVTAMLGQLVGTASPLAKAISSRPKLTAYLDRLRAELAPRK